MRCKMIFMCSVLLFFVCVCSTVQVKAQGDIGISAGLVFGTESEIGQFLRGSYTYDDRFSFHGTYSWLDSDPSADAVLGLDIDFQWRSVDLEGNYHIADLGADGSVYALAGLTLNFIKNELENPSGEIDRNRDFKPGVNLGWAYRHHLSDRVDMYGEMKYAVISDLDQLMVMAGIRYWLF